MTGIEVARRLGNGRWDPVPSRGKAMTVSITPLTFAFAGEVGPTDLRKGHDRETLEAILDGRATAASTLAKAFWFPHRAGVGLVLAKPRGGGFSRRYPSASVPQRGKDRSCVSAGLISR